MITIARLTFKEALRKKILLAAVILTLLFLALYGTGLHFISQSLEQARDQMRGGSGGPDLMIQQSKRMLLVLGIYFSSLIVSVLAVFSAVGSVSSEIENGMLHAILAKPVTRVGVILGKFSGYALMLAGYAALLFTAILLMNKTIANTSIGVSPAAIGLFVLQPLVLLGVTIAGSTRLSTLANGIAAFMVYMLGIVGGMVEQIGAFIKNEMLVRTGIVSSLLMPADALYRKIVVALFGASSNPLEAFSFGPFGAVSEPSTAMVIYAFIYLFGCVTAAAMLFTRRDIG